MLRRPAQLAVPHRLFATRNRRPTTPIVDVEAKIADFPTEQRKQIMDRLHDVSPRLARREVDGGDFAANLIVEYLGTAETPSDLKADFWKVVRTFANAAAKQRNPGYVDLFATLFDAAKSIQNPVHRQDLMYKIGRYIYRQKKVRMDPFNEVEFLDAMVAHGRSFNALKYWKSRCKKPDVEGSLYWSEVGALFHLDAHLVRDADAISLLMREEFDGYVPPRVLVGLIEAYSRQIRRGNDDTLVRDRLRLWACELFAASSAAGAREGRIADGSMSTEEKLQERRAPEGADLTKAMMSLIAARQWGLAAELLQNFEIDDVNLKRALETSNAKRGGTEEPIMPFLDMVLTRDPVKAEEPRLIAALVLYFARSGDTEDMSDILCDLRHRQMSLPDSVQALIAREILRQHNSSLKMRLTTVEALLGGPSATREVLRYLRQRGDKQNISEVWSRYQGKLTNGLALEALRTKCISSVDAILKLGISAQTWQYIWYLIATRRVQIPAISALKAMFKSSEAGSFELSIPLLSIALQATVVSCKSLLEGSTIALATLKLSQAKYSGDVSAVISAVLLETIRKVSTRKATFFAPPSKKIGTESLDEVQDDTVSWLDLVNRAGALLDTPNLESAIQEQVDYLSKASKA